jgi:hypothetical protein
MYFFSQGSFFSAFFSALAAGFTFSISDINNDFLSFVMHGYITYMREISLHGIICNRRTNSPEVSEDGSSAGCKTPFVIMPQHLTRRH